MKGLATTTNLYNHAHTRKKASIVYQRRLLQISPLLTVLYTEISDQTFLYIFSSRFWSIKSFKALSECESRIVGCSPNFDNVARPSKEILEQPARRRHSILDSFLKTVCGAYHTGPLQIVKEDRACQAKKEKVKVRAITLGEKTKDRYRTQSYNMLLKIISSPANSTFAAWSCTTEMAFSSARAKRSVARRSLWAMRSSV